MTRSATAQLMFAAVLLAPTLASADNTEADAESAPEAQVVVVTAAAVVERVARVVTSYGAVEADPDATDVVALPRAGVIRRLLVRPGERVQAGQSLLELDTAPGPKLQWEQAQAAVKYAEQQLARLERMAASRLATTDQVAQARRELSDAQASERSLRSVGADTAQQILRATKDAIVTQVLVNVGDRTSADAPALSLAPLDGLIVRLGVEPEFARGMPVGASVKLASVFDPDRAFDGVAKRVHAMLDPSTRRVDVIVAIAEAEAAALTLGEQMRGSISIGDIDAIVVPRSALLRDESGDYVFAAVAGQAHRIDVEILLDRALDAAIRGDLVAGIEVVVTGGYQLSEGTRVVSDRAAR
jgi:RND family efflux transporter MFP subunit